SLAQPRRCMLGATRPLSAGRLRTPCRLRLMLFFFFSSRRRHTRFSRDWSSDVCSSDLAAVPAPIASICLRTWPADLPTDIEVQQIGRASCRERGVDLGGRRISKKKKKKEITTADGTTAGGGWAERASKNEDDTKGGYGD